MASITSDAEPYGRQVIEKLKAAGLRVDDDFRNEKINYKVREHSLAKVPVIAVIGRKEAENGQVALRRFGSDQQSLLSLEEAVQVLSGEARAPDQARTVRVTED